MVNNKVQLIGQVFGKPKIKGKDKGALRVHLTIVLESTHRNAKGRKLPGTLAINVVGYDGVAKMCENFIIHKLYVVVEGTLTVFHNVSKSGHCKPAVEVTASRIYAIQDKEAQKKR